MPAEEQNLISAGASLLRAVSNGDADAVGAALAEGAYVDHRGRGGHTALIVAAIFDHVDIARLLLAAGADVRLQDNLGLTAKEWADRRGSAEVAKLLLEALRALLLEKAREKSDLFKGEADSGTEAAANITLQQLALRMTREQPRTKAEQQAPDVAEERFEAKDHRASAPEMKTPRETDTLRWMKFHKQIMAAQERRDAEEARREADHDATSLSEQEAVATWSSSESTPLDVDDVAPSLSEPEAVATWSSSESTPLDVNHVATSLLEPEAVVTGFVSESTPRDVGEARQASRIEKNISPARDVLSVADEQQFSIPEPHRGEVDEVARFLSELDAAATWSSTEPEAVATGPSTGATISSEQEAFSAWSISEPEAVATGSSIGATISSEQEAFSAGSISEPEAVATGSSREATDSPGQGGLSNGSSNSATTGTAEAGRSTAAQSARIAATIGHLRVLEESQQVEGPTRAAMALDVEELDATLEHLPAQLSTPPAAFESNPAKSLNLAPIKRCPKCKAGYGNPQLTYCAFDATKLVSVDDSLFNYSAANDRSWQTLGALVVIVAVLGASLGYLINNYRSRGRLSSAPSAVKVEQPLETTRKDLPLRDLPLVDGALSGMEVNVPQPEYPAQARAEGISGTITVRVQVNEKGRVVLARSSGGDWRLRAAAVEAAQEATFSPERLAVHGRVVSGTITYYFVTQTRSSAPTGSPAPTQTDSPFANGSSSATGSSAVNVGGERPVVGGSLVGAESNLPQPDYPEKAKSRVMSGTITVVVRVNRAGKVISWHTLEGDPQLRAAVVKAAKKATFSPEKLPGRGEVLGTITYTFKP